MLFHFVARAFQGGGYPHDWHKENEASWLMLKAPGQGACFCNWNHKDQSRSDLALRLAVLLPARMLLRLT